MGRRCLLWARCAFRKGCIRPAHATRKLRFYQVPAARAEADCGYERLEKVLAFLRSWNWTGWVTAPNAVAFAGDEAVRGFANGTRNQSKDCRKGGPGLRQDAEAGEDGVGANQEFFDGPAGVAQNKDGVRAVAGAEILESGWDAVSGEEFLDRGRG
jgi:hypothetical protein